MTDAAGRLAARWLGRASSDLAIASKLLIDQAYDEAWAAAFHGQQAAEKAIKAILVSRGTDFPKTHDLARLVALLPGAQAAPASPDDLEWLAYFGTAGRYVIEDPMAASEPDWKDAAQAVDLAHKIVEWASHEALRQGWHQGSNEA